MALVPLVFLSSDSKVWRLALSFLYQATEVYSQPLDWLPVGYVLILVQSAVVRRDGLVVPAPGSVTWEWANSGTLWHFQYYQERTASASPA